MKTKLILASGSPRRRELLSQIGLTYEVVVSEAAEVTSAAEPKEICRELACLKARDVAENMLKAGAREGSGPDEAAASSQIHRAPQAPCPAGGASSPTPKAPCPAGGASSPTPKAPCPAGGVSSPTPKAPCPAGGASSPTPKAPCPAGGASSPTPKAPCPAGGSEQISLPPVTLVIGSDTIVAADGKILGKPADAEDARRMLRLISGREHQVCTGVCVVELSGGQIVSETSFADVTDVFISQLTEEDIEWYLSTGEPFDKAGAYGIQGYFARFVEKIDGDYNTVVGLPAGRLWREIIRKYQ